MRLGGSRPSGWTSGSSPHQRRPQAHDGGRAVPRGPVLPLHVIAITLPPPRAPRRDIPVARAALPREVWHREQQAGPRAGAQVLDLLTDYDWPATCRTRRTSSNARAVLCPGTRIGATESRTTCAPLDPSRCPRSWSHRRDLVQGRDQRRGAAPDRVHARGRRRRAEARRRSSAHQADHAQRDDQSAHDIRRGGRRPRATAEREGVWRAAGRHSRRIGDRAAGRDG